MSGQLEWSALTARGNSRTWRKNCTAKGPRAARGSRPSAMRRESGWRPKARPASIIARSSSTNAPPPGIGPGLLRRAALLQAADPSVVGDALLLLPRTPGEESPQGDRRPAATTMAGDG